jgi:hypothetical protein
MSSCCIFLVYFLPQTLAKLVHLWFNRGGRCGVVVGMVDGRQVGVVVLEEGDGVRRWDEG